MVAKVLFALAFLVFLLALVASFELPGPGHLSAEKWAIVGLALVALGLAVPVRWESNGPH